MLETRGKIIFGYCYDLRDVIFTAIVARPELQLEGRVRGSGATPGFENST